MKSHINDECPLKKLTCDDCKESLLRQDMDEHKSVICPERFGECPYAKYGCTSKVKWKDLDVHLAKCEMQHLKLQVM